MITVYDEQNAYVTAFNEKKQNIFIYSKIMIMSSS